MSHRRRGRRAALAGLTAISIAAVTPLASTGAEAEGAPSPSTTSRDHRTETVLDRFANDPTPFGERLFFGSRATGAGVELWRSDGTRRGTRLLKDLRPGRASSSPSDFFPAEDMMFFFAQGRRSRTDLWKTDGTRSGTVRVKRGVGVDTYDVDAATVGNRLFFFATDQTHGRALWRSNGKAAGTVVVEDHLEPGWEHQNDMPDEMVAVGDTLFFAADDRQHGRELWKSDGTVRGTTLVKDVHPGRGSRDSYSGPRELTAVGGQLFFTTDDGSHGRALWRSNGTGRGTVLVRDISSSRDGYAGPRSLTALGRNLYFAGTDDTHGTELWRSDGTRQGTVMVADLVPHNDDVRYQYGAAALTVVGRTLFFVASTGDGAAELWSTDGTAADMTELTDINPAEGCPDPFDCQFPSPLTGAGGTLYFGVDPAHQEDGGPVLWATDGSPTGTQPVDEFSPVPQWAPAFDDFTSLGDTLFLTARDGVSTEHLLRVMEGARQPTCHGFPATITGAGAITGTDRADVIVGSDGPDRIDGRGGNDIICAGGGDDVFLQGADRDGSDSQDGQGGSDTVSYADRTTAVRVNLHDGAHTLEGAREEYDSSFDVENAEGGGGDDTLIGNDESNRLDGGGGDDVLTGSGGDDIELGGTGDDFFDHSSPVNGADDVHGQAGIDTITLEERHGPQRVTLDTGIGDDGGIGEGDTMSTLEDVIGGFGDDVIVGSAADNVLDGGEGNDRLTGGGGSDTVVGGYDDDVLALRDQIGGNDSGDGGSGTDTATYDDGDVVTNVP